MTLPISISSPCGERWGEMTLADDGTRLCTRCERRVTDFRGMGDYEIALAHALADGPICGVYDASQLRDGAAPPPQPRGRLVTLALGATLLSGTAAAQATIADGHPATIQPADAPPRPQPAQVAPTEAPASAVDDSLVIYGTVSDAAGRPVPGTFVLVEGTHFIARTDSLGAYRLGIERPAPAATLRLRFFTLGYDSRILEVPTAGAETRVDVTLGVSVLTTQGIVVKGVPRRNWLSRMIHSIF